MNQQDTEFQQAIKDLKNTDFNILQKVSQKCTEDIIFNLLDKKTTIQSSKDYISQCQSVISEYRSRMLSNMEKENLKDAVTKINSQIQTNNGNNEQSKQQ